MRLQYNNKLWNGIPYPQHSVLYVVYVWKENLIRVFIEPKFLKYNDSDGFVSTAATRTAF